MESKFKVGDRVKIIGVDCSGNNGFIGIHSEVDHFAGRDNEMFRLKNDFDRWMNATAFPESSLQLLSGTTKHHRRIPLNMEV